MSAVLTCQWCGASGFPEDFELDEQHNDGFWCPDCDGHTFYDPEQNKRRRVLLLLESEGVEQEYPAPPLKFKKRLSPLRYPGGKSKLIDRLYWHFYKDQMDVFIEVFAGGASVGLAMLEAGLTKRLVLNDLDPGVYAFWKTVVENPRPLLDRLDSDPPTAADFKAMKGVLDNPDCNTTEQLAWAQLICNRLGFSGITKSNARAMGDLLSRWNPKALKKRIEDIHQMAAGGRIEVTSLDANTFIEQSAYWEQKATLFIDPPYVAKGKSLYRMYYSDEEHIQLAFLLETLYQSMPGADIVITYDDCELIRELYSYATVETVGRYYSI